MSRVIAVRVRALREHVTGEAAVSPGPHATVVCPMMPAIVRRYPDGQPTLSTSTPLDRGFVSSNNSKRAVFALSRTRLAHEHVARGGVEPPTYRFSGGRSYQLSYLARILAAPGPLCDPDGTRTRDLRRDRATR